METCFISFPTVFHKCCACKSPESAPPGAPLSHWNFAPEVTKCLVTSHYITLSHICIISAYIHRRSIASWKLKTQQSRPETLWAVLAQACVRWPIERGNTMLQHWTAQENWCTLLASKHVKLVVTQRSRRNMKARKPVNLWPLTSKLLPNRAALLTKKSC